MTTPFPTLLTRPVPQWRCTAVRRANSRTSPGLRLARAPAAVFGQPDSLVAVCCGAQPVPVATKCWVLPD